MTKKKLGIIIGVVAAVVVLAVAAVIVFAGGNRLAFSADFADDLVFDYGVEQVLPTATVVNRFGVPRVGETVTYTFTPPADGKKQAEPLISVYPVAPCDVIGQWTVDVVAGNLKVTKTYTVVDRVAPVIKLGATPNDVLTTNTEKEYSVPAVTYDDFSAIDYTKTTVKLYRDGEEVSYNTLTGAFDATVAGKFVFKVHAVDVHGNASDAEVSWRAKDPNWKDANLPAGYLASFDDPGYVNLSQSGFINRWWGSSVTEEWLEEYEGETGVLKIMGSYANNLAAVKVYLSKYITAEQLGDGLIVVKYRMDDTNTGGRLTLAGNVAEEQESAVARYFAYKPGEWAYATVTAADLKNVHYADEDGYLRSLQYGFNLNGVGDAVTVYLASVTVAEKLDTPANVKISDNTLTWDAVKGAESYRVLVDGIEHIVKEAKLTAVGTLYQVQALGDGMFTVDSEIKTVVDATPKAGYLTENNAEFYASLIWNNGIGQPGGMEWYESDTFAAAYDKVENAVRLDMTHGYVCAGAVMKFPQTANTAELDNLIVRLKLDANTKRLRLFPYGRTGTLVDTTDLQVGWNTIVISKEALTSACGETLDGLQLVLFGDTTEEHGDSRGAKITAYVGSVTVASKLSQPENVVISGNTLTWDAVPNATGYLVVEDDKTSTTVKTNSYKTKGGKLFTVTALGDGLLYADSEQTIFVNGSAPEGYLSENNQLYYQYLVWNNGLGQPGGMEWYDSKAFAAAYDKAEKAIRLELAYGYVNAGVVMQFPQPASVSGLDNVVVRLKVDDSVRSVRLFPYGRIGLLTDVKVQPGWNTIVIPKDALIAAVGEDGVLQGLQIAMYNTEDCQQGVDVGKAMTAYLGEVTVATRLQTPTVTLDGDVVRWDAVDGASDYLVTVNGQQVNVTDRAYSLADSPKGVYTVAVTAIGDDRFTLNSEAALVVWSNLTVLTPPTAAYADGKLTLSPVEGAIGYELEVNGKVYTVNAAELTMSDLLGEAILAKYRVRSKGDYIATADSVWSNYAFAELSPTAGALADFDKGYLSLVWNNGKDAEGGMEWYDSQTFAASYGEDGLTVTMDYGYVCAGMVAKFPAATPVADIGDYVAVRVKFDDSVKAVRMYPYGSSGRIYEDVGATAMVHSGWNTLLIPKEALIAALGEGGSLQGLQLVLYSNADAQMGMNSGSTTVVLGGVYNNRQLSAPVASIEDDTVRWSEVDGAESYDVYVANMLQYSGLDLSYTIPEMEVGSYSVRIVANGNGLTTTSSDTVLTYVVGAKEVLGVPTGITMTGTTMSWDAIPYAAGYELEIDGVCYIVNVCSADLVELSGKAFSAVDVRIRTKGNGVATVDSAWSEMQTVDLTATLIVSAYPEYHKNTDVYLRLSLDTVGSLVLDGGSVKLNGVELTSADCAFIYGWSSNGCVQTLRVHSGFRNGDILTLSGHFSVWSGSTKTGDYQIEEVSLLCTVTDGVYSWSEYAAPSVTSTALVPENVTGTWQNNVLYLSVSPSLEGMTTNDGTIAPSGGSITVNGKETTDVRLAISGWSTGTAYLQHTNGGFAAGDYVTVSGLFTKDGVTIDVTEVTFRWDGSTWSEYVPVSGQAIAVMPNNVTGSWQGSVLYLQASPKIEGSVPTYQQFECSGGSILVNGTADETIQLWTAWNADFLYIQNLNGSFAAGDIVTLSGVWTVGDVTIDIAEIILRWDGSAWSEYVPVSGGQAIAVMPNNVTGSWQGSVLYLQASPKIEGSVPTYQQFSRNGGGITVNGIADEAIQLWTAWNADFLYIQNPNGSFAAGDIVTLSGVWTVGDGVAVDIAEITIKWTGSAWETV